MQIFAEAGAFRPPSDGEPNDWIVHLTTSDLSLGTYSIPAGGSFVLAPRDANGLSPF